MTIHTYPAPVEALQEPTTPAPTTRYKCRKKTAAPAPKPCTPVHALTLQALRDQLQRVDGGEVAAGWHLVDLGVCQQYDTLVAMLDGDKPMDIAVAGMLATFVEAETRVTPV